MFLYYLIRINFLICSMDGDKPKKDSPAKNKQCSNSKQGLTLDASTSGASSQPTNHNASASTPTNDSYAQASGDFVPSVIPVSLENNSNVDNPQTARPSAVSKDMHHSLNSKWPANGATLAGSPINSVSKASSTGSLISSSPPQCHYPYLQTNKRDTKAAADFLTSYPVMTGSGSSHNLVQVLSGASANSSKTANSGGVEADRDIELPPPFMYPPVSLPSVPVSSTSTPPQNQNQATYNWQASKTCVKDRLAYLYNTDTMTDVQFKVRFIVNTYLVYTLTFYCREFINIFFCIMTTLFRNGKHNIQGCIF